MTTNTEAVSSTFHELGLDARILNHLDKLNYTIPTPIQLQSIPVGLSGKDVIGIAQTGTGKTLAFGLPILQRLVASGGRGCGRALVIVPTRELALQVEETLQKIGSPFRLRSVVLIGGAPMRPQLAQLAQNPDVIVATPGRLIDHLQQRSVDLRTVDVVVLDEADRMLDMGFAPQIQQILRVVPEERQTMLYSATMPDDIVKIAQKYMNEPTRVEVARAGSAADQVTQELFVVPQEDKNDLLEKVLDTYSGTVLVFSRTRSRARRVARHLQRIGHTAAEIHSDRTLVQRRAALDGFKAGKYRVLVATDIAARGIDVIGIELVLNYDLPDCAEDYVHRIGRTGRAGLDGHAISFAAPDQQSDVRQIEKLLRTELVLSGHSTHSFPESTRSHPSNPRQRGRSGRPGGPSRSSAPRPAGPARPSAPHAAPHTAPRVPETGMHAIRGGARTRRFHAASPTR